jgi:hypothetical protein
MLTILGKSEVEAWYQKGKINLDKSVAICWHCLFFLQGLAMALTPMVPA